MVRFAVVDPVIGQMPYSYSRDRSTDLTDEVRESRTKGPVIDQQMSLNLGDALEGSTRGRNAKRSRGLLDKQFRHARFDRIEGPDVRGNVEETDIDRQLNLAFDADPEVPSEDRYSTQSAEQGDKDAQFQLAQNYQFGISCLPRDPVQALVWYKAAETNGHPLGARLTKRVSEGLPIAGLAEAEYQIGSMFQDSTRVRPDQREAVDWFCRAASHGQADAQMELGRLHEASDVIAAYAWYNVSAKQDSEAAKAAFKDVRGRMSDREFADACARLGEMYRSGTVIPPDESEALYWYREAARAGVPAAEFAMGEIYRNGEGVASDDQQAFEWYLKAAYHGVSDAQYEVGEMRLVGDGVRQDPVEGLAWLYIASIHGSKKAETAIQDAEQSLTDSHVSAAKSKRAEVADRIDRDNLSRH